MLDPKIRRRLESLTRLPAIPYVVSEVMQALDNPDISASTLANIIEKDQTLASRVLTVANSPFYGFARKISTIDLAIVVLGTNAIREIVISLLVSKLFVKQINNFDVRGFWHYSVFCGACARVLARKLGYRLVGEAFVAGLIHDIGIIVLTQYFSAEYAKITTLQTKFGMSMVEAEKKVMHGNHGELGVWIAERWNLPAQLCDAIRFHHSSFLEVKKYESKIEQTEKETFIEGIEQPLTLIVAMSEWFAAELNFKQWALEQTGSPLYLAIETLEAIKSHDILSPESAIWQLKQEITKEYEKATVFHALQEKPLY